MNIIRHFITITKHRLLVMKLCFKCGLYYQGLTHDLSKYSFVEFFEGVKYYVGTHSPISECRKKTGMSMAWLHHKGRNKHHGEYWMDNGKCLVIPYKYAVESICDQIAAGKNYKGKKYDDTEPLNHWVKNYNPDRINKKTAKFFEQVFTDLSIYGENKVLNKKYLKETYKRFCE